VRATTQLIAGSAARSPIDDIAGPGLRTGTLANAGALVRPGTDAIATSPLRLRPQDNAGSASRMRPQDNAGSASRLRPHDNEGSASRLRPHDNAGASLALCWRLIMHDIAAWAARPFTCSLRGVIVKVKLDICASIRGRLRERRTSYAIELNSGEGVRHRHPQVR
jgi:hypothetical protein